MKERILQREISPLKWRTTSGDQFLDVTLTTSSGNKDNLPKVGEFITELVSEYNEQYQEDYKKAKSLILIDQRDSAKKAMQKGERIKACPNTRPQSNIDHIYKHYIQDNAWFEITSCEEAELLWNSKIPWFPGDLYTIIMNCDHNLNLLEWFWNHGVSPISDHASSISTYGNTEILDWLKTRGILPSVYYYEKIRDGARDSYFNISSKGFNWLKENTDIDLKIMRVCPELDRENDFFL